MFSTTGVSCVSSRRVSHVEKSVLGVHILLLLLTSGVVRDVTLLENGRQRFRTARFPRSSQAERRDRSSRVDLCLARGRWWRQRYGDSLDFLRKRVEIQLRKWISRRNMLKSVIR